MSRLFLVTLMLLGLTSAAPLQAQGWDAARQASSWAYQDVDGSLVFYDQATRELRTWLKGSGLMASTPIALPEIRIATPAERKVPTSQPQGASDYDSAGALLYGLSRHGDKPSASAKPAPGAQADLPRSAPMKPERWATDTYNRTWVACGDRLAVLGKQGKPDQLFPLPAGVVDMAAGRDGLFLLYRTAKPFLEKRDLRTGAVLWTYGDKSQLNDAATQPLLVPLNRMVLGSDGTLYIAEGAAMAFTALDPAKGPGEPGQVFFTWNDVIPPRAVLGRMGRGPLLSWAGKDVVFGVFTPNQVKSCGAPESSGLLLARYDLAKGTMEWLPTSLAEGHLLVGLLEDEAVFLAPKGGLAFSSIH